MNAVAGLGCTPRLGRCLRRLPLRWICWPGWSTRRGGGRREVSSIDELSLPNARVMWRVYYHNPHPPSVVSSENEFGKHVLGFSVRRRDTHVGSFLDPAVPSSFLPRFWYESLLLRRCFLLTMLKNLHHPKDEPSFHLGGRNERKTLISTYLLTFSIWAINIFTQMVHTSKNKACVY